MSPYMERLRDKIGTDLLLAPAAGAAVFDSEGRLLQGRHVHDGLWATIGGGVEPGEHPAQAALRELHEETGLDADVVGLVGAYGGRDFEVTYPDGARVGYVVIMYGCRLRGAADAVPQHEELHEVTWVGAAEAAELPRPADMEHIIPDAFAWWDRYVAHPEPGPRLL